MTEKWNFLPFYGSIVLLLGPWPLFQFLDRIRSRLNTKDGGSAHYNAATYTQNKTNTEYTHTGIHPLSGIRSHDPSVRTGEDTSCPRPRGHYDRRKVTSGDRNFRTSKYINLLVQVNPNSFRLNIKIVLLPPELATIHWTNNLESTNDSHVHLLFSSCDVSRAKRIHNFRHYIRYLTSNAC
jgi:hypothetical protein